LAQGTIGETEVDTDWQDTAFQDGFNTDADFPGFLEC
jgi:hypothetical protein